jgi:hypothetical protein
MTNRILLGTLVAASLLLLGCPKNEPSPEENTDLSDPSRVVTLVSPIEFAEDSRVRDAIRAECRLPQKLERFIKQFSAEQNIAVNSSNKPADQIQGEVLVVEIVSAFGPGGGAYSGGKSVTIEAKLTDGDQALGDLEARRVSGGGAFAAFKGTCDILGRNVRTLGSDVATFLVSPHEGARMGNL